MAKQELIEVGYYLGKTPRERIDYLIDNYSRMEEILERKQREEIEKMANELDVF